MSLHASAILSQKNAPSRLAQAIMELGTNAHIASDFGGQRKIKKRIWRSAFAALALSRNRQVCRLGASTWDFNFARCFRDRM